MKLRNKETGEIMDLECITIFDRPDKYNTGDAIDEFYTLAELNEEWEDYKPKEPLIKDEKIRKAIRAWAEANNYSDDTAYTLRIFGDIEGYINWSLDHDDAGGDENEIHFTGGINTDAVQDKARYTIADLCGDEEE